MEGTYQSEEVLRDAPTATVPGRAGSAKGGAEIIRLEYDQERQDRYGRGYGHAYTRFPFRHLDGCRFLSKSRIPMPRDEAVQRYELCAVCAARLRSKR